MRAASVAAASLGLLAPALAGAAEVPWDLRLAPGLTASTTVTVDNRCATSQRFSLAFEPAVPWLRLIEPRPEREVPPAASASAEAMVDTRDLEPGLYETLAVVECATCAADPSCHQDRDLLAVRLQVPWTRAEITGFDRDPNVAPGELLALLPPLGARDLRRALRDLEREPGLRVLRTFPLPALDRRLVILGTGAPGGPWAASLERLQERPEVSWAQPSFLYRTLGAPAATGDPLAAAQYAARMVGAFEAHGRATGRGVRLAMIDSGVASDHPDLAGRLALNRTFLPAGREPTPHRHGTGVAGLIGAGRSNGVGIVGVAPDTELIALEACSAGSGEAAVCTSETVARALDAALGEGARIVNLSLGGPRDPLLARLAREALRRRVLLVAAAGNEGPEGGVAYPAALPEVLAVTAIDAEERPYALAARGAAIELAAPGVETLAPVPGDGFHPLSGTSMAAAHVSGLAALALELAPGLGPEQLRAHLRASALDLGAPGFDEVFGHGRVDACALLARVVAAPVCSPAPAVPGAAERPPPECV